MILISFNHYFQKITETITKTTAKTHIKKDTKQQKSNLVEKEIKSKVEKIYTNLI